MLTVSHGETIVVGSAENDVGCSLTIAEDQRVDLYTFAVTAKAVLE